MPFMKQKEKGANLISCCLKGVFILLSASHRSFDICITEVHVQVALKSIETFLELGQSHVGFSSCTCMKRSVHELHVASLTTGILGYLIASWFQRQSRPVSSADTLEVGLGQPLWRFPTDAKYSLNLKTQFGIYIATTELLFLKKWLFSMWIGPF